MDLALLEKLTVLVGIVVDVSVIISCVRKLPFRRSMAPVFFTFSMVSTLMSAVYWLTFELLRAATRIPFAANLFAEFALFLLLAASLNAVFQARFVRSGAEILCTLLFTAASTALWIAWNGRWLEDLLVGLCFGYLLCVCVRSLKQSRALSGTEWRILGAAALVLLLLQGATFVLPDPWNRAADTAAYVLMFSGLICIFWKLIRGLRLHREPDGLFALSVSCAACSISTMYMSAGILYLLAQCGMICSMPLILLALRREEAAP